MSDKLRAMSNLWKQFCISLAMNTAMLRQSEGYFASLHSETEMEIYFAWNKILYRTRNSRYLASHLLNPV